MPDDSGELLNALDVLRHRMHLPKTPLPELCEELRHICAQLANMEQEQALATARAVPLTTADVLPLMRRATLEDPDEELGAAALLGTLTTTLSGYGEHTTQFVEGTVSIRLRVQPQAAGTATRVWHAARLASWACETGWAGLNIHGQRVLELGCGTAALGLACAALGASEVWLTDNESMALDLAQRNAELNGLQSRTRTAHFDLMSIDAPWGMAVPQHLPVFDVIVASDVLYDVTAPEHLAATISRLLAHSVDARALVVSSRDPSRSELAQKAVTGFVSLASNHAELHCVQQMSTSDGVPSGDLIMQLLGRKFSSH